MRTLALLISFALCITASASDHQPGHFSGMAAIGFRNSGPLYGSFEYREDIDGHEWQVKFYPWPGTQIPDLTGNADLQWQAYTSESKGRRTIAVGGHFSISLWPSNPRVRRSFSGERYTLRLQHIAVQAAGDSIVFTGKDVGER